MPKLLTKKEMADRFQVSQKTIAEWVRHYEMPCVRINKNVLRFDADKVEEWATNRMDQVTA